MSLGERLKIARIRAGYHTARAFAQALEIPYTTYVQYENRGTHPKLDVLFRIAVLANITVNELLEGGTGRPATARRTPKAATAAVEVIPAPAPTQEPDDAPQPFIPF